MPDRYQNPAKMKTVINLVFARTTCGGFNDPRRAAHPLEGIEPAGAPGVGSRM
jgi:hypothetical protein